MSISAVNLTNKNREAGASILPAKVSPPGAGSLGLLRLKICFVPWLFCGLLHAQLEISGLRQINREDGLSQGTVNDIIQDHMGYMWFATEAGLNQYDGYQIRIYKNQPENAHSLSDNYVNSLHEDSQGNLWIATGSGLNRFDREQRQFVRYLHDPGHPETVTGMVSGSLFEGFQHNLWLVTDAGLTLFSPQTGRFESCQPLPTPLLPHGVAAARSSPERPSEEPFWVLYRGGIYRLQSSAKVLERYASPDIQSLGETIAAAVESSGPFLWLATGNRLGRLRPSTGEVTYFDFNPPGPNMINALLPDHQGRIWLGTDEGLSCFDTAALAFIGHDSMVHHRGISMPQSVKSLYLDSRGHLWAGTDGNGVYMVNLEKPSFQSMRRLPQEPLSLASDMVRAFHEDETGTLWVGTDQGLNALSPENQWVSPAATGFPNPAWMRYQIRAISEDPQGRLWFATNRGLAMWDPKLQLSRLYDTSSNEDQKLISDGLRSLLHDQRGTLWIGTNGKGLQRMAEGTTVFEYFSPSVGREPRLRGNFVNFIYEDTKQRIWVGTDRGLNQWEPSSGSFKHFLGSDPVKDHPNYNMLVSICEDRTGMLWVGIFGGSGLSRFDPETEDVLSFGQKDGLPSDNVVGILEDATGKLWLSTTNGICQFDPVSRSFRNYSVDDGINSIEFNSGAQLQTRSGRMFFGGTRGFSAFYPQNVKDDPNPPAVVLTDFLVYNRSSEPNIQDQEENRPFVLEKAIDQTRVITLSHRHSVFSLEFAALHYASPEKNSYAYRLEGFDRDWNYTDANRRFATYTNLDPGTYQFQVKASNKDGIWNQQGTGLGITITPPPWRTWWAYLFYALVVTLTAALALKTQRDKLKHQRDMVHQLQKLDKLKDTFLATTSHELKTPLYGMMGLAESLSDDGSEKLSTRAKETLTTITSCGKRLSRLITDILDYSKLRSGYLELHKTQVDLYALTQVIFTLSRPLIGTKDIRLDNQIDPGMEPVHADEDRLQQVLHNLVTNAIKFSDQGTISVSAQRKDSRFWVRVEDQGVGMTQEVQNRIFQPYEQGDASMDPSYGGMGLGLWIAKQLVELHGGTIHVASKPGRGSLFSLWLPSEGPAPRNKEGKGISHGKTAAAIPYPEAQPKAVQSREHRGPGSTHILIVDDETINRTVLGNQLELAGYGVTTAASGNQAFAVLGKDPTIDLVLLDIMMPSMSGFEVCRRLRKKYSFERLPIIFLTARNQPGDMEEGFRLGGNDFLTKPISKDKMLARVKIQVDLLHSRQNLENTVEDRTREIAKQAQQLRDQTWQLRENDAQKTRFFTNLSHDLRTPLTLITAPLEQFRSQKKAEPLLQRQIDRMHRQAGNMLDLVNQILDLSKMDAGQMPFRPICDNLVPRVREWTEVFSGLAKNLDIQLVFKGPTEPLLVHFEPQKLERVLANLLSNAFTHTQPKGSIQVDIAKEDQGSVVIRVSDNGQGIPENQLPHVFDRFHSGPATALGSPIHSGIGLALCKEIATLHNGRIQVQSQVGRGTRFSLELPMAVHSPRGTGPHISSETPNLPTKTVPGQTIASEAAIRLEHQLVSSKRTPINPSTINPQRPTLLIIEDHPDFLDFLTEHLSERYNCFQADNGSAGLKLAFDKDPDLILCDFVLPGIDGIQICRILKKDPRTRHIPLLILTARTSEKIKIKGLESGVDDVMTKPFQFRELQARIHNMIMSGNRWRTRVFRELGWHRNQDAIESADVEFLQKVVQKVESDSHKASFGVRDLASEMGLSRRQLHRKIRILTGENPSNLVRQIRMRRATELLRASAGTISEIAYEAGFKNLSHFSKLFKQAHGKSPREFASEFHHQEAGNREA